MSWNVRCGVCETRIVSRSQCMQWKQPCIRRCRSNGFRCTRPARPVCAIPADASSPDQPPQPNATFGQRVQQLFQPFKDEDCNRRFWAIALGQMLCSVATLMHDSYLPVYLQNELGLSSMKIGALQAASQFLSQLSKGVSGVVGDLLRSQVKVVIFGTVLTMLCKPMFALSGFTYVHFGAVAAIWVVGIGKLLDRTSKGIREAPTKALVQNLAVESGDTSEAAFGLRQSLATLGALIGSFAATAAFIATGHNFSLTFAIASLPPLVSVLWLYASFKDHMSTESEKKAAKAQQPADSTGGAKGGGEQSLSFGERAFTLLTAFQPAYWQALAVIAALYFARFDFSFVTLRAKQVMPQAYLPMLVSASMIIQVLCATWFGNRAKQGGLEARNNILLWGFAAMIAANVILAHPAFASFAGMVAGCLLIGLHMGATHALTISMISSYMPYGDVRGLGSISGTAQSVTDLLLGVVLVWSNLVAGRLADITRAAGHGNVGCFGGGAAASVIASILLIVFTRFGDLNKPELVAGRRKRS